jgi:hypothetical protein
MMHEISDADLLVLKGIREALLEAPSAERLRCLASVLDGTIGLIETDHKGPQAPYTTCCKDWKVMNRRYWCRLAVDHAGECAPVAMTDDDLIQACRNIGFDLTCGNCAGQFYTGSGLGPHTCPRWGIWVKESKHDNGTWWWPDAMRWEGNEVQARAAALAATYMSQHPSRTFEARAL